MANLVKYDNTGKVVQVTKREPITDALLVTASNNYKLVCEEYKEALYIGGKNIPAVPSLVDFCLKNNWTRYELADAKKEYPEMVEGIEDMINSYAYLNSLTLSTLGNNTKAIQNKVETLEYLNKLDTETRTHETDAENLLRIISDEFARIGMINPLHTDASYYVLRGGRSSGKSYKAVDIVIYMTLGAPAGAHIGLFREIQLSIEDSNLSLVKARINDLGLSKYFNILSTEIVCLHNNAKIIAKGLQAGLRSEGLKGIEKLYCAFVDEAAKMSKESIDMLLPTLLRTEGSKLILTYNPMIAEDTVEKEILNKRKEHTACYFINYYHNRFLSDNILREIELLKVTDENKYKYVYEGDTSIYFDSAIVNQDTINKLKRNIGSIEYNRDDFSKIVISVDPAVVDKETSDKTGVIVLGQTYTGEVRVLADVSGNMNPATLGVTVKNLSEYYQGSYAIYEANQGGDYVRAAILSANPSLEVKDYRSVKSKVERLLMAMPEIEKGTVTFDKDFNELCEELMFFTYDEGYIGPKSPDRTDAFTGGIIHILGLKENSTSQTLFKHSNFTEVENYYIRTDKPYILYSGRYYIKYYLNDTTGELVLDSINPISKIENENKIECRVEKIGSNEDYGFNFIEDIYYNEDKFNDPDLLEIVSSLKESDVKITKGSRIYEYLYPLHTKSKEFTEEQKLILYIMGDK